MKVRDILLWINNTIRKHDKSLYIFMILSASCNSIFILSFSFLPKILVGSLVDCLPIKKIILYIVIFGLVIGITKFIYTHMNEYCAAKYMKIRLSIICEFGLKFMNVNFSTINSNDFLDKSQKADNSINGNQQGYECVLKRLTILISNLSTCIISLCVIASLTPILMIPVVIVIFISRYLNQKAKAKEKAIMDEIVTEQRKADYFFDAMSNVQYGKEIRLNSFAPWLLMKLKKHLLGITTKKEKIYDNNLNTKIIIFILNFVRDIIINMYLIEAVMEKTINIGDYLMYFSIVYAFSTALMGIMDDIVDLRYHCMFVEDLIKFEQELKNDVEEQQLKPCLDDNNWTIRFEHVSFKYPNTDCFVLKDINFEIRKNEKIAVIGLNGSGKTTMIKLLTRLYDATEGAIYVNNINIQNYNRTEYYSLFAPMFQEVFMFAFSLGENISIKNENEIDLNRLENAIQKIHFEQKVKELPKGFDTSCMKILDEDGVQFSGGEEQKILLARALYKDSPIIILDEPTSSMDPISEDKLYQEFNKIINDKTTIFITHRLASTRFCHRIYVFKDGEIIETGSHDELILKDGEYNRLFSIQKNCYQGNSSEKM